MQFKKSEGYTVEDFLQFGFDHFNAGHELFKTKDPKYFASAGYLMHLGVELILKAWHLQLFDFYTDIHNLEVLLKKLEVNQAIELDEKSKHAFKKLNSYYFLRYPRRVEGGIEIGGEDLDIVIDAIDLIWKSFPEEMRSIYHQSDLTRKGGQVLMIKKIT